MRLLGPLLAAALVAGACSESALLDAAGGSVAANEWELAGLSPDEQHLLVSTRFGGVASGCTRFEGWQVEQGEDVVTITALLWRRRSPSDCTAEGVAELLQVDLDQPLGDRTLAGCGGDDCLATVVAAEHTDAGQIIATATAVAIDDGRGLDVYRSNGEALPDLPDPAGSGSGELLALAGDVVVRNEGVEAVATNLISGDEVWRTTGWTTAATEDTVYVCRGQDSDGLSAVDAETGRDRWETDLGCEPLVANGDLLTVVTYDRDVDGGSLLLIVDAKSGTLMSSEPFSDGSDDQVAGFDGAIAVGSKTLVSGPQANLVILAADGRELKRQTRGLGVPIGQAEGIAIVGGYDRTVAVDPASGAELWSRHVDAFATISVADGSVWLLDRRGGTVSRLDPLTGAASWTADIGLTSSFDVAAGAGVAYVVTTQAVVAIDNTDGDMIWWRHRPHESDT